MDNANTHLQLQMGKLLLIGILISMGIVMGGAIYYLLMVGQESVYTQTFYSQPPQPMALKNMLHDAFSLTPLGIIQFGVFTLVFTQLFRVILVGWYFIKMRDWVFTWINLFIFSVVIYSLLWKF